MKYQIFEDIRRHTILQAEQDLTLRVKSSDKTYDIVLEYKNLRYKLYTCKGESILLESMVTSDLDELSNWAETHELQLLPATQRSYKYMWLYIDGERICNVSDLAIIAQTTVQSMKNRLKKRYEGKQCIFRFETE